MTIRISRLLAFIMLGAFAWVGTDVALAQNSVAEFHTMLREKAAFDDADFADIGRGQTVVNLLPAHDKREVAVSGLVSLHVTADKFLQSYRESMARKNSAAILEIGRFSSQPTLDDLNGLTIESRDIEDLKTCVVGDCRLKLSATMIERLRREVDWTSSNYSNQATQLLKTMLLDYVRDYMARGDVALMEYSDKTTPVRLAQEQRALKAASSYAYERLAKSSQHLNDPSGSGLTTVENAIVWSKIKFGLKPVLAINHITIYKNEEAAPQVLIVTKQIYANHYFDSSLGLMAFVNVQGASPGSYLFYENRSRADGLGGMFGKLKRGIVEDKAVDGLKAILEQSRANLDGRSSDRTEVAATTDVQPGWRRWKFSGVRLLSWLLVITAFGALLVASNYRWRGTVGRSAN